VPGEHEFGADASHVSVESTGRQSCKPLSGNSVLRVVSGAPALEMSPLPVCESTMMRTCADLKQNGSLALADTGVTDCDDHGELTDTAAAPLYVW